jgi:hypothetical protein
VNATPGSSRHCVWRSICLPPSMRLHRIHRLPRCFFTDRQLFTLFYPTPLIRRRCFLKRSRRNSVNPCPSGPYVRSNNSALPGLTSNSHRVTNNVVPSPALGCWQFLLTRNFREVSLAAPRVAIRLDTNQSAVHKLPVSISMKCRFAATRIVFVRIAARPMHGGICGS